MTRVSDRGVLTSIAKGRCPACGATDLHDGPRAMGMISQNINVACFSCNARFNLTTLYNAPEMVERTPEDITKQDRYLFRDASFSDAWTMAASPSWFTVHIAN